MTNLFFTVFLVWANVSWCTKYTQAHKIYETLYISRREIHVVIAPGEVQGLGVRGLTLP